MQQLIKALFKGKVIFSIAVGVTVFIGFLSLMKSPEIAIKISHSDKIFHAIAYFILTLAWLLSYPASGQKKKIKHTIGVACVFYGILIEVLQVTFTTYRTASALDVLANSVGVFVALLIFNSVYKKINAI